MQWVSLRLTLALTETGTVMLTGTGTYQPTKEPRVWHGLPFAVAMARYKEYFYSQTDLWCKYTIVITTQKGSVLVSFMHVCQVFKSGNFCEMCSDLLNLNVLLTHLPSIRQL